MNQINEQQRTQAVALAAEKLGRGDEESVRVLARMWEAAFEEGRLAALDEFQDRFCVCMKS